MKEQLQNHEQLLAGENTRTCLPINCDTRGHERHRAGGDDDVFCGDSTAHVNTSRHGIRHRVGTFELAQAQQDVLQIKATNR